MRFDLRFTPWAAATLLALAAPVAQAALGQPLGSASRDGQPTASPRVMAAKAASGAGAVSGVSTQAVLTPEGDTVVEYANAGGIVFAITWTGPFSPNLQQLLGQYFPDYVQAPTQAGGLTQSSRDGKVVSVRASGHMRSFSGVAWVPALVPAGFDPQGLQP